MGLYTMNWKRRLARMTCALGMDCALLRPPFRCSVTVRGVSCCWTADSMVSRV